MCLLLFNSLVMCHFVASVGVIGFIIAVSVRSHTFGLPFFGCYLVQK